ncbi:MAG: 16S rRNA (guanine(527)-N(7))-methyltransferase RsmG [bacterium]
MIDLKIEAKKLGLDLNNEQLASFEVFFDLLTEWNQKFNLTAITEKDDVYLKHFLDSLTIVPHIPDKAHKIIDIGSGAGFPGLPIKIARPDLNLTLTDSVGKKIFFIDEVIKKLDLKNTIAINNRAEELGRSDRYREKFDVATARAVAHLSVLCEYVLPLIKIGGIFIASKIVSNEEIEQAGTAIRLLGGKIKEIIPITYPDLPNRQLIIIEKISETPDAFPRTVGIPSQDPL